MSDHKMAMATPSGIEIVFTRVFDAPRELIWRMWTEPQHLAHWWGPRYFTLPACNLDLRAGGTWHYAMRDPVGNEYWGIATYREVSPPERLSYSDAFSNADGDTIPPVTEVIVTFADQGGQTLVTSTHVCSSPDVRKQLLDMQMDEGMASTFECLDEYLLTATTEREIVMAHDFDGPPELVFKAWSDPEHLPRWFGPAGATCVTRSLDLREGGAWDFVMHAPDGNDYPNYVRFVEIAAPERLVYAHGDGPGEGDHFQVTVTFARQGAGTRLVMRAVFPSREVRDQNLGLGALELGQTSLAKLGDYLTVMV